MGEYITMSESVFIALISMMVVFLVLVLISILIYGLGFIKEEEKEVGKPTKRTVPNQGTLDVSEESIAVIAATLISVMNTNVENFKINSIKKVFWKLNQNKIRGMDDEKICYKCKW